MASLDDLLGQDYVSEISAQPFGAQKINYLMSHQGLIDYLSDNEFNGYHVSQIVLGADWLPKLQWIENNYETILEPLGFNGYHISQIVTNADWQAKLNWIENNYQNILKPLGITQSQAAKIIKGKEWLEKMNWITQNYHSQYSTNELRIRITKKDWRRLV